MVLGKLPAPERPTMWEIVEQGPIALAVGAGGGVFHYSKIVKKGNWTNKQENAGSQSHDTASHRQSASQISTFYLARLWRNI